MSLARRRGPTHWVNVHATTEAHVKDLIDLLNPSGSNLSGTAMLKAVGGVVEELVQEAREGRHVLRGLGAGWALTDLVGTDGWLLNTKILNGRFNVPASYAEASYPEDLRPNLIIAQCGASVAELNRFLETTAFEGRRRCLKTAGIGAGQTIAGAVSGNTHGSAVKVGAMPDMVVGLQLVNGTGRPIWLERASRPIMNQRFVDDTGSRLVRNDALLDAALVSFGAFGIITAVALETDPIYQLWFAPQEVVRISQIKQRLAAADLQDPGDLHHYEFVFNPYDGRAMEAVGLRRSFTQEFPTPEPRWLVRSKNGLAPGNKLLRLAWSLPLPARTKCKFQFDQYLEKCILGDVQGTPGQLFTATITYSEGMTESAFAVPIGEAPRVIDLCRKLIKEMSLPVISQVRVVAPTRATLGFTHHGPRSVVFEFGVAAGPTFARFERQLIEMFRSESVPLTFHWSKNAGLDPALVRYGYGDERVNAWLVARATLFEHDPELMALFTTAHLRRCGLAEG